jgi:hypothetical protein
MYHILAENCDPTLDMMISEFADLLTEGTQVLLTRVVSLGVSNYCFIEMLTISI